MTSATASSYPFPPDVCNSLLRLRATLLELASQAHVSLNDIIRSECLLTAEEIQRAFSTNELQYSPPLRYPAAHSDSSSSASPSPIRIPGKAFSFSSASETSHWRLLGDVVFGVEIEVAIAKRLDEVLTDSRVKVMRDVLPLLAECLSMADMQFYDVDAAKADTEYRAWKVTTDASIVSASGEAVFGLEFISPMLQGRVGLHKVECACEALGRMNFTVNNSTALHVHLSCCSMTDEELRRFCEYAVAFEPVIDLLLAVPRRCDSHAYSRSNLRSISPTNSVDEAIAKIEALDLSKSIDPLVALMCPMLRKDVKDSGRNHKLNLIHLKHTSWGNKRRQIEFRQHHATLDVEEVGAWIAFLSAFMRLSCRMPVPRAADATIDRLWAIVDDPTIQALLIAKTKMLVSPEEKPAMETREFVDCSTPARTHETVKSALRFLPDCVDGSPLTGLPDCIIPADPPKPVTLNEIGEVAIVNQPKSIQPKVQETKRSYSALALMAPNDAAAPLSNGLDQCATHRTDLVPALRVSLELEVYDFNVSWKSAAEDLVARANEACPRLPLKVISGARADARKIFPVSEELWYVTSTAATLPHLSRSHNGLRLLGGCNVAQLESFVNLADAAAISCERNMLLFHVSLEQYSDSEVRNLMLTVLLYERAIAAALQSGGQLAADLLKRKTQQSTQSMVAYVNFCFAEGRCHDLVECLQDPRSSRDLATQWKGLVETPRFFTIRSRYLNSEAVTMTLRLIDQIVATAIAHPVDGGDGAQKFIKRIEGGDPKGASVAAMLVALVQDPLVQKYFVAANSQC